MTAVTHQHRLLAKWLSGADGTVLDELRAAHTDDFTLVTMTGEVLDRDTLFSVLEGAAGAQEGLSIEIGDVTVVTRMGDAVLVRFLETHLVRGQATARRSTALLWGGRWAYVHETAVR